MGGSWCSATGGPSHQLCDLLVCECVFTCEWVEVGFVLLRINWGTLTARVVLQDWICKKQNDHPDVTMTMTGSEVVCAVCAYVVRCMPSTCVYAMCPSCNIVHHHYYNGTAESEASTISHLSTVGPKEAYQSRGQLQPFTAQKWLIWVRCKGQHEDVD